MRPSVYIRTVCSPGCVNSSCRHLSTTFTLSSSELPRSSGAYIASILAGSALNSPGTSARKRYTKKTTRCYCILFDTPRNESKSRQDSNDSQNVLSRNVNGKGNVPMLFQELIIFKGKCRKCRKSAEKSCQDNEPPFCWNLRTSRRKSEQK